MTDKIIRGSGGGRKSPPAPTRAPDSLNSRQFASIQDLLSEGEIEGFATPSKAGINNRASNEYKNAALKDIFLNDTPILRLSASNTSPATGDFNFQNVSFTPRFGTANQQHIPGIESSQSVTSVGVSPTNPAGTVDSGEANAVTRQITNTNVDAAKITITFPQLQKATDEGDLLGSSVQLKIQIQYNGGGFNDAFPADTITGRTADTYQKEYRVNIDGSFPVDIRVVRLTKDSTSSQLVDKFTWTSIGEIVDDKQTYPNSAYTNIRIDSEQFSSVPTRAFRIRGIKVKIPGAGASNSGTPTVDLQTGRIIYPAGYIFNGTMGAAQWCSCPAMILLDLLTTERYGFGTHITQSSLDLYSFVAASRYANEQVDDLRGGSEARFSCNVNIQGTTEAYTLINELAGVMRAFPIWQTGSITLTQDRPTDPSYLFSLANVGEGGFSYSGSSLKQRHSVISVSYFNMDSREIDYEVVGDNVSGPNALQEDIDRQAKLGVVKKDVKAFACTSRGQAFRLGKAILFSEEQESEVVSFTTSIDAGAIVRPGSVIRINDPVRSGARRAGRIKSVNNAKTEITVDNPEDLSGFMGSGTDHKCSVMLPNGTVEQKNISLTSGIQGSVIHLDSALSEAPNVNSMWLLHKSTSFHQTFRVITVEEQDGINYAITALTYLPAKYATIDSENVSITLPDRNVSLLNQPVDPPSNLRVSNGLGESKEIIFTVNALAVSKILLTWVPVTGVTQYLVQYRFNNSNFVSEVVFKPDFEILNSERGTYEFKVFSFNAALQLSATSSDLTFNALGKTVPPADVQNLTLEPITNKLIRLRWSESTDPDVIHGGKVYLRHSNKTDGTGSFQDSVDLIPALAGNTTEAVVPSVEGEYILKFRDDQGLFSQGETSVILDLPDLIDSQQIFVDREDTDPTAFGGAKTNVLVSAGALELSDPSANLTGTYTFAEILDLGAVFSLNLKRLIQAIGFVVGNANTIDELIPNGTFWDDYAQDGNFDGSQINDVSASIAVRTTTAAPSGSSYADSDFANKPFNTFANGTYKGRGFQFRLTLSSESIAHNISIQQLGITADFESRTERSYVSGSSTSTAPLTSSTSTSGLDVTFGKPFFVGTSNLGGANAFLPSVGITIIGAAAGDYFVLSNVTGTGFNIKILDSSNNPVNPAKQFTFQAVGYGKGV